MTYAHITKPTFLVVLVLTLAIPVISLGEGTNVARHDAEAKPPAGYQYHPCEEVSEDPCEAFEYDYGYLDDLVAWKSTDADPADVSEVDLSSLRPATPMIDYYDNPIPGNVADNVDEQWALAEERPAQSEEVPTFTAPWSHDDFIYGDAYAVDECSRDSYVEEIHAYEQAHAFDDARVLGDSAVDSDEPPIWLNCYVKALLEQTAELGQRFEQHLQEVAIRLAGDVSPVAIVVALHRLENQVSLNDQSESASPSMARNFDFGEDTWSTLLFSQVEPLIDHEQLVLDYQSALIGGEVRLIHETWFQDLVVNEPLELGALEEDALNEAIHGIVDRLSTESLFSEMVLPSELSLPDRLCGPVNTPSIE